MRVRFFLLYLYCKQHRVASVEKHPIVRRSNGSRALPSERRDARQDARPADEGRTAQRPMDDGGGCDKPPLHHPLGERQPTSPSRCYSWASGGDMVVALLVEVTVKSWGSSRRRRGGDLRPPRWEGRAPGTSRRH